MKKIAVIHGPNLNLLGKREPEIYGTLSLKEIDALLVREGKKLKLQVRCRQTNSEGEIINWIQEAANLDDGLILNPGAYTHTSVGIRDALTSLAIPIVEVHLSNIYAREAFRRKSLVSPVVKGTISGFGADSYILALQALSRLLEGPRLRKKG